METLSLHISHQVNLGVRELIRINHMAPPLSHLFYADDLTLMARAHPKNVDTIANSLKNFCALSGQSINRSKSSCSQEFISLATSSLGIQQSSQFGVYQGSLFFLGHQNTQILIILLIKLIID